MFPGKRELGNRRSAEEGKDEDTGRQEHVRGLKVT